MTKDPAGPPAAVIDVTVVTTEVLPNDSNLTELEAAALDAAIDRQLAACDALLRTYLETGHLLARMKETKGYAALGCRTWGDYLNTKARFGRTYLSYLLKLGRAGDPTTFLELDMPPGILMHYIKSVSFPEKVHAAIAATWDDLKGLPAAEAEERIDAFIDVHAVEFKKPRKVRTAPMPPKPTVVCPLDAVATGGEATVALEAETPGDIEAGEIDWEAHFATEWGAMGFNDRARYILAMERFIERMS